MAKIEVGCNLKKTANFFKSSCVFEKLLKIENLTSSYIGVFGGIS